MTIARQLQVNLAHTCYYQCISRCVRRAFLCGKDHYSGKDFSHRRRWLENRLRMLADTFAIDLFSYAIMSNHYHVVLRVDPAEKDSWTNEEVLERWSRLFKVPDSISLEDERIDEWRSRLGNISWFMRCVNEPLARLANKEDNCTGRFWEGRFKCQALLDERALLRCMAYVDLNPIRAGIAESVKASLFTSAYARLQGTDEHLAPLTSARDCVVPISRREYLQLLHWSAKVICHNKREGTASRLPNALNRMRLDADLWRFDMKYYGRFYYRAVGPANALQRYCKHLGQRWLKHAVLKPGRFQQA